MADVDGVNCEITKVLERIMNSSCDIIGNKKYYTHVTFDKKFIDDVFSRWMKTMNSNDSNYKVIRRKGK